MFVVMQLPLLAFADTRAKLPPEQGSDNMVGKLLEKPDLTLLKEGLSCKSAFGNKLLLGRIAYDGDR